MEIAYSVLRGVLGMAALLGICYLFSANRKAIDWKLVGGGVLLQFLLAVGILNVGFISTFFQWVADGFVALLGYTDRGAAFVFGEWPDETWIQTMDYSTGATPSLVAHKVGYIFAFRVLPTVVFFSAFSAILFYFGILQKIIEAFAWLLGRFMTLSGAESLAAAANVFIGQTEAPLVIRPYLERMTKSEILCLMVGGMATIAGGVFALFVSLLGDQYAIHFLTASIISAPAAIVAAKILYPETDVEAIHRSAKIPKERLGANVLDAISMGTTDGVRLAVNVGAMLLVFIALIALLNGILGWMGDWTGINELIVASTDGRFQGLSLEYVLGLLFAPFAWLLGVPSDEVLVVGQLLGKKTAINEVVAYVDLANIIKGGTGIGLSHKSVIIATYALCGFSNFSSIGIQIGGIGALAPNQRETLTSFGIKALIGGTVACFMTAIVAGVLVG